MGRERGVTFLTVSVTVTIDHSRKYHNIPKCSLFVTPKFCINIVFSFSRGRLNSQLFIFPEERNQTLFYQSNHTLNDSFLCIILIMSLVQCGSKILLTKAGSFDPLTYCSFDSEEEDS